MANWRERKEGGNLLVLYMIRWIILNLGRKTAKVFLIGITGYFMLVRKLERRASYQWLDAVDAPSKGFLGVYRHIYTFALTIVDRALVLSNRSSAIQIDAQGVEILESRDMNQGMLLLGSHLGSFEIIIALHKKLGNSSESLKVVMDRQKPSAITTVLQEISPSLEGRVIDASLPGYQIAQKVAEHLSSGGIVCMLADRIVAMESTVEYSFIGKEASFSLAPLGIAQALAVPVVTVFGLFVGQNRYRVIFEELPVPEVTDKDNLSVREHKRNILKLWVKSYVEKLETYARLHPYNWFNFYDYWIDKNHATARHIDAGSTSSDTG